MTERHPMPFRRLLAVLAAAGLALAAGGCGGDDSGAGDGAARSPEAASSIPAGADFDRTFIDAMVAHHRSALDMARSAQAAGLTVPALRQVAADVLATQQEEIDRMLAWRKEWFGSAEIDPGAAGMLGMSDDGMGMDNAADALLNSSDPDRDFATMMVAHHEGAVAMAELALERAEREELKELARAIVTAQEREIEVMKPHMAPGKHGGHG